MEVVSAQVSIGVFGLFHPTELLVEPVRGRVLVIETEGRRQMLEGHGSVMLKSAATVTARNGAEAAFFLSVPGADRHAKIRREFRGRLTVRPADRGLEAVVTMERETAVASIVAGESPGSPLESQKAQAVVSRSFLVAARGRHATFDFCDTTHCQYLKDPPAVGTHPRVAQLKTHGLVLTYQGKAVSALYSADCGGRTRTLADAGWQVEGYPYYAVECLVRGETSGHRIGLCQRGAAEMARHGKSFRDILAHYFPATRIEAAE
jgi:peptidoglycan hydrolase-like amidase